MEFREWLLATESVLVDPSVVQSYERGFQQGLDDLIARTSDEGLRSTLKGMKVCPIRDERGSCRGFVDYIIGTLIRHGCGLRDPEEALAGVYRQLMSPVNLDGKPRATLFGSFDEHKPFVRGTNPLEARFKTTVRNAVLNICQNDQRERRRDAICIVPGGQRGDLPTGAISADVLPARDQGYDELLSDLREVLKRQERRHPDIPVLALFTSMINGEPVSAQKARFGVQATELGRDIILKAINSYAWSSENWALLRLLRRLQDPGTVDAPRTHQDTHVKPKMANEQDYQSIISVLERNGRIVTLAQLQKDRRRWTEWKPRSPDSPHPNRLADVLSRMVHDGILAEKRTRNGGKYYVPGENYNRHAAVVG